MQRDSAVLELVERCVVVFIDADELLLKSFQFVFVLRILIEKLLQFHLEFG